MAGRFEISKVSAGKFRFRLNTTNGETMASGEAYDSKGHASGASGVDLT